MYGPPRPLSKHSSYGRVPAYLRERQLELAEAHARQQVHTQSQMLLCLCNTTLHIETAFLSCITAAAGLD